jgi:K+-transporting ATPase ATPase A chain
VNDAVFLTLAVLTATFLLALPLGRYAARVFAGERVWMSPLLAPLEQLVYRLAGIDSASEMNWKEYATALLLFNFVGFLALYLILRFQPFLPLDPQGLGPMAPGSAFNTAVSFVTNTNWQDYAGETTLGPLAQMLGLTVQNFLAAATGVTLLLPLVRGFVRHETDRLGNYWVDLTRTVLYLLLPLSLLAALVLALGGVPDTLTTLVRAHLVFPFHEGARLVRHQAIALGPVASQEAIKLLGNNGGGFFNANSAHPFENPTAFTNVFEIVLMLLMPATLLVAFARLARAPGTAVAFVVTTLLSFVPLALLSAHEELVPNPRIAALKTVAERPSPRLSGGGDLVGVDDRIGAVGCALFASAATATSSGAANCAYDSMMPLAGGVNLFLMQLGEVVFGGIGTGLASLLAFAVFAVFLGGLMVGRTPELLGKKIETFEIKMVSLSILVMPLVVLAGTALAVMSPAGRAAVGNPGAHGFSEILYALTSTANNNGSAFAGLDAGTRFYNLLTGLAMLFGRYWVYLPLLAMAGALARKKHVPVGAGTLPTHTLTFVFLLGGSILLVGALNFIPALVLGPVADQILLYAHHVAPSLGWGARP